MKHLVRIVDVLAEIQTVYLSNISQKRYLLSPLSQQNKLNPNYCLIQNWRIMQLHDPTCTNSAVLSVVPTKLHGYMSDLE
jgi:hypothetical protein